MEHFSVQATPDDARVFSKLLQTTSVEQGQPESDGAALNCAEVPSQIDREIVGQALC